MAEARATFENPRVRLLLVARGETLPRRRSRATSLADGADPDATLAAADGRGATRVAPADPVARAVELLDAHATDRLPVVADDGAIVGLVCFNRRHGHFCVDG